MRNYSRVLSKVWRVAPQSLSGRWLTTYSDQVPNGKIYSSKKVKIPDDSKIGATARIRMPKDYTVTDGPGKRMLRNPLDFSRLDAASFITSLSLEDKKNLDRILENDLKNAKTIAWLEANRNWTPRPYQRPLWNYLHEGGRRACVIWHRRSGKDDVALNWAAEAAHRRVAEYWHMLPEAAQGRKVVWEAVNPHTGRRRIDQAFPVSLRKKTRENDMVIEFTNGSLWRVVGSDNYNRLIGSTPAGVVFSEWALADPNAWAFLRPILMENGGWAIFITTPRGSNHAKTTLDLARQEPSWFAEVLPVEKTKVFSPEALGAELRELQHDYGIEEGQALFEQEYNCSFESALVGSYYGPYLNRAVKEGRICRVPIDRAALVHTSWDLGVSDSTAIWFIQKIGKETRLIDYHEASGVGLDEYARVLSQKRDEHKIVYGLHYFPHDVTVRELGNKDAQSREDTLKGLGIRPVVVPQHHVMDGVNAVRRMLDATWIDEVRCERGLNALRNYRRAWDEKLKMFRDAPLHDWASHGADSLRTFAAGYRDPREKAKTPAPKLPRLGSNLPAERGTGWMGR